MNKLRNLAVWYYMFTKRLFKRWSFIIILLLIPALIPAAHVAMSDESGVMTVALCSENRDDSEAKSVIADLTGNDSIIRFVISDSVEDAYHAVRTKKADAAWIFKDDLKTRIEEFVSDGFSKPFVTVVAEEDTIFQKISREVLYGKLYPSMSFEIYKNYVYSNLLSESEISEEELREYYDYQRSDGEVVEIKKLGSEETVKVDNNFLVTPLRGLLAIVIMLCGISAAMYFLKDQSDGKFDWLAVRMRYIPAFGSCFAAVLISSAAVIVALFASGIASFSLNEIASILIYVFAASSFSMLLATVFNSASKLGGIIPLLLILMLALCPIFFSISGFDALRMLFPPYYYLMSVYNPVYLLFMLLYTVLVCAFVFVYNKMIKER